MHALRSSARFVAVSFDRAFRRALLAAAASALVAFASASIFAPAFARAPRGVHTATARATAKPLPPSTAPTTPQTENAASPASPQPSLTNIPDISKAVPVNRALQLPSTEERYRVLQTEIDKTKPDVDIARSRSEALKAEADALRQRLINTAARIQSLEEEKVRLGSEISVLAPREQSMAQSFARDRVTVSHLLGILERLQYDMPPVIALRANDALGAAQGAMLLGASLPRVYGAAADLARRLEALRHTRAELVARRAESARNAVQLSAARDLLDQLLATKQDEADTAAARYGSLQAKLDTIAKQATDLGQLMQKVAALRAEKPADGSLAGVPGLDFGSGKGSRAGILVRPVVGKLTDGGMDGVGGTRAPGVTFLTQPGAQVVAPADSEVLFAGPYHKAGQVLILEMGNGYDLVLAGLDRVDVKVGDRLLTGEPLGTMPRTPNGVKLYFELRHNGKGASPAPWLGIGIRKAERS